MIIVKFAISQSRNIPIHLYHLLESHLSELGLIARYQKMALQHMSDARGSYRRLFNLDGTGHALALELRHVSDDLAANYGPNYWLSVLHSALANEDDFWSGGFTALEAIA